MAYGTLVPLPRITPVFPAVEAGVLTIGSASPYMRLFTCNYLEYVCKANLLMSVPLVDCSLLVTHPF